MDKIDMVLMEFCKDVKDVIDRNICPETAFNKVAPILRGILIDAIMPKNKKFKRDDVLLIEGKPRHIDGFNFKMGTVMYYPEGRSSKTNVSGKKTYSEIWQEVSKNGNTR